MPVFAREYQGCVSQYTNKKALGVYLVMSPFIRSAAITSLLVALFSTLIAGCASRESHERTTLLSLKYDDFDQTYGSGFRVLYDRGQYFEAAVLIGDYLKTHPELTAGQQKFLHFHAAQLYALAGKNTVAVRQLDQVVWHEKTPRVQGPRGSDLNDMAAALRAFLTEDRAALLAAKDQSVASNLVENLGSSYADALLWHRLSPNIGIPQDASKTYRAAAEKLAKAFSFPVIEMQTNPPTGCVWLEMRSFHPFAFPGYVIMHSRDGTLISASDEGWLNAAVHRFIQSARERNGHYEARVGLTSSFDTPK